MAHFCAASPLLLEPSRAALLLSALDRPELKTDAVIRHQVKFRWLPRSPDRGVTPMSLPADSGWMTGKPEVIPGSILGYFRLADYTSGTSVFVFITPFLCAPNIIVGAVSSAGQANSRLASPAGIRAPGLG
jgi:hypothetical protein